MFSGNVNSLLDLLNPVHLSMSLGWSGKHCIRCFTNSRNCWRRILRMKLAKWRWTWKLLWWNSTQPCWDKVCLCNSVSFFSPCWLLCNRRASSASAGWQSLSKQRVRTDTTAHLTSGEVTLGSDPQLTVFLGFFWVPYSKWHFDPYSHFVTVVSYSWWHQLTSFQVQHPTFVSHRDISYIIAVLCGMLTLIPKPAQSI